MFSNFKFLSIFLAIVALVVSYCIVPESTWENSTQTNECHGEECPKINKVFEKRPLSYEELTNTINMIRRAREVMTKICQQCPDAKKKTQLGKNSKVTY